MKDKIMFTNRIDPAIIEALRDIAMKESKKTGYRVTVSGLVEKILREFVEGYKL